LHLPVGLHGGGEKLSKQNGATAIDVKPALPTLLAALRFLGQPLPNSSIDLNDVWQWAITHWSPPAIPRPSLKKLRQRAKKYAPRGINSPLKMTRYGLEPS
jgi:glutamyl/glutaminyl-tRNA synthetase